MMVIRQLSADVLEHAKRIFSDYKARGIILNNSFDDDVWKISDEKCTTKLMSFDLKCQTLSSWIGCSAKSYYACVKVYIAFNFGELAPFTLQDISRELLRISFADASEAVTAKYPNHMAAFLQLLPGGSAERDWVIEQLSERESSAWGNSGKAQQRVLSDFQSYLHFNDVLADFWATAEAEQKLFYFPLYFWWNFTAILPLRVTELLLTPRNCLDKHDGKYSITVRRSKLKGGGRKLGYRIAEDYEPHKYEIAETLGRELDSYLKATKDMAATQLDTLFLVEPHRKYLSDGTVYRNHRYYSYYDMIACMRSFYEEVVVPSGVGISPIKLGDTRHLAMVNLIISGGSPIICRELAGHADINISSHYYTNISNLVECATIKRLRKNKGGSEADITGKQNYALSKPIGLQRVTGGFCESETFQNRDISECLKAVGTDGQIGECAMCRHYRPDEQGLHFSINDDSAAKAAVDADSRYLMQAVELVRKGLGYPEDIGAALLRLQHSGNRYAIIIKEKFDNGKT